jgi:hypothetical protein
VSTGLLLDHDSEPPGRSPASPGSWSSRAARTPGSHPSAASLYRAFAEAAEAGTAAVTDDGYPLRPRPARIRQDGEPLTAGEAGRGAS